MNAPRDKTLRARAGVARPPIEVTVAFIDERRQTYGVEPICRVLPIAPSRDFPHKAPEADPTRRSARAQCDDELCTIIQRIWTEHQVYGPRKVWRQMGREKLRAARPCLVTTTQPSANAVLPRCQSAGHVSDDPLRVSRLHFSAAQGGRALDATKTQAPGGRGHAGRTGFGSSRGQRGPFICELGVRILPFAAR